MIIDKIIKTLRPKTRIIKRTGVDFSVEYVIQQKHLIFRWWWVDAWINSPMGALCKDSFNTLEEAQRNMCYFYGTPEIEEVIIVSEGDM